MRKPPLTFSVSLVLIILAILVWTDLNDTATTIPVTTHSALARLYFIKGRNLAERLREHEACDYFERAVSEDPQFAYACLYLARLHSNVKTRLSFLARAEELSGNVSEGERLLIQGARAHNSRQPQEERDRMERLVEAYPNDPRAHNEFGNSLYWQKDWPAAIEQYLKAVEMDPSYSQPYNGLGYCYRSIGELLKAENCFVKYLQLLPDDPNPYDSYADLLSEMGRHEEAITFYQKAIEIRDDFSLSHLGIARNYCVLGDYSKAIDQLTVLYQAASDDNRRRRALLGIATVYIESGDLGQALSSIQASCDIARNSGDQVALSEDLHRLGLVLLEAGRPDDASRAFSAALQAIQDIPNAPKMVIENAQLDHMHNTALVWLTRGDLNTSLDLAGRYLNAAIGSSDPSRVQQAHQTLGLVELASGNVDRAIEELSLSDVSEAYTQYHLARAYEASGSFGQALKYYRLASTYDQFNSLTQAFVRTRAKQGVESLLLARQDTSSSLTATEVSPTQVGLGL